MVEGGVVVARILERLAQREMQLGAVARRLSRGAEPGFHLSDVVCVEAHGLQVGEAPPDLPVLRALR